MSWLCISQFNFSDSGTSDNSGFGTEIFLRNGALLTEEGLLIDNLGSYAHVPELPVPVMGLKIELEFKMNPLSESNLPLGRQNIIGSYGSFNIFSHTDGRYHANFLTTDYVWKETFIVDNSVSANSWDKIQAYCDGEGLIGISQNNGVTWGVQTADLPLNYIDSEDSIGGIFLGIWPKNMKHYRAGGIYKSLNIYAYIPEEVKDRHYGRGRKKKDGKRRPMDFERAIKVNEVYQMLNNSTKSSEETRKFLSSKQARELFRELANDKWHNSFRSVEGKVLVETLKTGNNVRKDVNIGANISDLMEKSMSEKEFKTIKIGASKVMKLDGGILAKFLKAYNPNYYSIIKNLSEK